MPNTDLIILIFLFGITMIVVVLLFKQITLKPRKDTLRQRIEEFHRLYQELNDQVETNQIRIMELERKHSELLNVCSEAREKTSDALITIEDAIEELGKPKTKTKSKVASKKGKETGITSESILAEMKKNDPTLDFEKMQSPTLARERKNAYRRIYRQLKKDGN